MTTQEKYNNYIDIGTEMCHKLKSKGAEQFTRHAFIQHLLVTSDLTDGETAKINKHTVLNQIASNVNSEYVVKGTGGRNRRGYISLENI